MLSICVNQSLFGAAWRVTGEDTLYALAEDTDLENLPQVLDKTEGPILGSLKIPSHVMTQLSCVDGRELHLRPSKDYAVSVFIPMTAHTDHNELSLKAMNAMVKWRGENHCVTDEIQLVSMFSQTKVSLQSLQDLDVISFTDHPNPHFGQTMSSGCLVSLLVSGAKSAGGKALMRKWLCFPSNTDHVSIGRRQDEIELLLGDPGLIERLQGTLRGVKNVQHLIAKMQVSNNSDNLKAVVGFMERVLEMSKTLGGSPLLEKVHFSLLLLLVILFVDCKECKLARLYRDCNDGQ
jgi:DNA mismatch repair ATPase MutS